MSENLNGLSENLKSCLVDLYWHIITIRAPVGANKVTMSKKGNGPGLCYNSRLAL